MLPRSKGARLNLKEVNIEILNHFTYTKVANSNLKPGAKRHHVVSGTFAPLYTVFGLKLGCSGAAAPIGDEVL